MSLCCLRVFFYRYFFIGPLCIIYRVRLGLNGTNTRVCFSRQRKPTAKKRRCCVFLLLYVATQRAAPLVKWQPHASWQHAAPAAEKVDQLHPELWFHATAAERKTQACQTACTVKMFFVFFSQPRLCTLTGSFAAIL